MRRAAHVGVVVFCLASAAQAAAPTPDSRADPQASAIDPLVAATAGLDLGPDTTIFPRPAILAPNVAFWTEAFSYYSEFQSVIHSEDRPEKVYAVLDFRNDVVRAGPNEARRLQGRAEKAIKREIDQHLRQLHARAGKLDGLTPSEQKLHDLFADSTDANRFRNAVGSFRSQRGLKEKTERALRVSGQYLPKMEGIFAAEGLPPTLTRLPLVESSFNVEAYSKVGAAGLWQFMPSSARIYMRLDEAVDDRRDPWTSTQAAARHLKEDYELLGSWPLAITAYNHGRGGLSRGLREVKGDGLEDLLERWNGHRFGFASRNFYAEFLAAVDVERDYRRHFGEIERHAPLEFEVVQIQHYVPYEALRRCAGLTEDEFRTLNPGFRPEVLDGRLHVPANTAIRVPVGMGQGFMAAYLALGEDQRSDKQLFYYVRYRVQRGDNLGLIARRYGVSVSALKHANGIGSRSFIRAGQVLRIPPRGGSKAHPVKVAAEASASLPYALHHVRPGQTLTAIAQQYRTTIAALRRLNQLDPANPLHAGAIIKVPSN